MKASTLPFLIRLEPLQLLVNGLHKLGQLDLILVALLNELLLAAGYLTLALVAYITELLEQGLDLALGLRINFVQLRKVVLTVLGLFDDSVGAERLVARHAEEKHLGAVVLLAEHAL